MFPAGVIRVMSGQQPTSPHSQASTAVSAESGVLLAQEVFVERAVPVEGGNQAAVGTACGAHASVELEVVDQVERRPAVDGGHDVVNAPVGKPSDGERDDAQARAHNCSEFGWC